MGGGAESLLYPCFLLALCIGGAVKLLKTRMADLKDALIDLVRRQVKSRIFVFDTFASSFILNRRSVVFPHH